MFNRKDIQQVLLETLVACDTRTLMELEHFDKHSPTSKERKAPLRENPRFFCLETVKTSILNKKFYP